MTLEALKIFVYRWLPGPGKRLAVRLGTPSYTAGAIGLVTDGERLLLVQTRYRGGWRAPGGFLARREQAVEALERELREELGVTAAVAEAHRVFLDPERRRVTFISVATIPATAPLVVDPIELSEARWFPLDALPLLAEDYAEQLTEEDLAAVRAVKRSGAGLDPR